MNTQPSDQTWHALSEEILTGMHEWRVAHPTATLREMETEVDARLARLRARMLEDMALQSPAADWAAAPGAGQLRFPSVGCRSSSGANRPATSKRTVGANSPWNGAMASALPARRGFFPLDEELGLLPGSLTPGCRRA